METGGVCADPEPPDPIPSRRERPGSSSGRDTVRLRGTFRTRHSPAPARNAADSSGLGTASSASTRTGSRFHRRRLDAKRFRGTSRGHCH